MRYSKIREMDISNGDGISCSIFFQGCPHHCKNCFNPETWDFYGGCEFTKELQDKFIELCKKPYINHISVLGGEPLSQSDELYFLLSRLKKEVKKPIWLWTGYQYEYIVNCMGFAHDILNENLVDILIDGKFVEELKDLNLKYRGSSNQRVVDVKETNKQNKVVLYCD